MLFEGIKLMFVGMTTVMLFLILMILFISLVARLTKGATARELDALQQEREIQAQNRKEAKQAASSGTDEDIAVIAAAVASYEAERFASVQGV